MVPQVPQVASVLRARLQQSQVPLEALVLRGCPRTWQVRLDRHRPFLVRLEQPERRRLSQVPLVLQAPLPQSLAPLVLQALLPRPLVQLGLQALLPQSLVRLGLQALLPQSLAPLVLQAPLPRSLVRLGLQALLPQFLVQRAPQDMGYPA